MTPNRPSKPKDNTPNLPNPKPQSKNTNNNNETQHAPYSTFIVSLKVTLSVKAKDTTPKTTQQARAVKDFEYYSQAFVRLCLGSSWSLLGGSWDLGSKATSTLVGVVVSY